MPRLLVSIRKLNAGELSTKRVPSQKAVARTPVPVPVPVPDVGRLRTIRVSIETTRRRISRLRERERV